MEETPTQLAAKNFKLISTTIGKITEILHDQSDINHAQTKMNDEIALQLKNIIARITVLEDKLKENK